MNILESVDKRFVIGIDLGTTNCAVAYTDLQGEKDAGANIRLFKIPQLIGPGEVSRLSVLPSFLYLPGAYDLSSEALQLPWGVSPGSSCHPQFVGAFARDHGAKIPSRQVSSAKSWLCHPHADRKARILPWGAGSDVYKVSPIQATAAYLEHIKAAWNSFRGEDEDQYLENQLIILTVPASFDEVARELLYDPIDRVILPAEISPWIEALISENWTNPLPAGQALLQLARKTGDRSRDVDSAVVERIQNWLFQQGFLTHQVRVLSEIVPIRKQEVTAIFGENLPFGLILGAPLKHSSPGIFCDENQGHSGKIRPGRH